MKLAAVISAGLVIFGLASVPADAQTRQRSPADATRYTERGEDGRTRTRVIIQRRSFLDAGTEVKPGERKYTDYFIPPAYSPTSAIDNTVGGGYRHPLPGYWDLPGKDNPYPWQPY
jgi:hypothetical protein